MKNLVAVAIAMISLPLSASSIPTEQALELCRAEQNALRRLTCYDNIQAEPGQANTRPAQTLPAQAAPQAKAATSAKPVEAFGMEHKQNIDNSIDELTVTVKSISYSPHKELIVEFDNGQRWRQIGSEYYSIKEGQQHRIKRGALSSFFLANDNNNRTVRVRRID